MIAWYGWSQANRIFCVTPVIFSNVKHHGWLHAKGDCALQDFIIEGDTYKQIQTYSIYIFITLGYVTAIKSYNFLH